MKKLKLPLLVTALALTASAYAQTGNGLRVTNKFPIKSAGGWNYLTVDADGKRIFVSHGNQVNILSTNGDSIGVINGTNGVHGITLVKTLNKGYTSNGKLNNCTVLDMTTYKPITTIAVGTNPDALFYDDRSKKVYVFNGKSNDASVIDPATDKVIATIPLGGKPEACVADGKGSIYVNSETTNEVVVFSDQLFKVTKRFKLSGEEPSGLAIDKTTNRLFIACAGTANMLILDATTGKEITKFKTGDSDGIGFDAGLKLIYSSNREGTLSVVRKVSANKFVKEADVITEPSARTIAVDPLTHKIYLPAAILKADPNDPKAKSQIVVGSFHIIEIGR